MACHGEFEDLLDLSQREQASTLEALDSCERAQPCDASRSHFGVATRGAKRAVGFLGLAGLVACCLGTAGRSLAWAINSGRISTLDEEPRCAVGLNNCNETKCCEGPGLTCYEQDGFYAQCKQSCTTGPSPTHWDGKPWSCKALGERSEGKASCAGPGEECTKSMCCGDSGYQCYQKNEYYASCKVDCAPGGPDLTDTDGHPWTCKKLGERTPGVAPWVSSQCSAGWSNCLNSGCCKAAGQQCYKQNDYFAACRPVGSCPKEEWSCETIGSSTPSTPMKGGKLSSWVFDQCTKQDGDCSESRCCLGMDLQCYKKDKFYAQCRRSCQPGPNPADKNDTWSCEELGPRSYGLAVKGFPSLYCFSVLRIGSYEEGLMAAQHKRDAGIFQCDHFSLLTADGHTTIDGLDTLSFEGAPIVTSVDNTAGNTQLFINAWRRVIKEGEWAQHAFTVKADPDAVFLPERLRWHLSDFVGKKMFIVNCPLWNMIYGALEVFSFAAVEEWANRGDECNHPNNIGEDKYMTNCMDFLHVMRVRDDNVLGDMLCHTFTTCDNADNVAYHPFKSVEGWMQCWDAAHKLAAA